MSDLHDLAGRLDDMIAFADQIVVEVGVDELRAVVTRLNELGDETEDQAVQRAWVAERAVRILEPFAMAGGSNDNGEYASTALARVGLDSDVARICRHEQHMAFGATEDTAGGGELVALQVDVAAAAVAVMRAKRARSKAGGPGADDLRVAHTESTLARLTADLIDAETEARP